MKTQRWFTARGVKWHRRTTEKGDTAKARRERGVPEFVSDCITAFTASISDRGFQVVDKRPPSAQCCRRCMKLPND